MGWSGLLPRAEETGRGHSSSLGSQKEPTGNGELAVICWVSGVTSVRPRSRGLGYR